MAKLILCLVGKLGSGKGAVATYLQENHQAGLVMFSQCIRDILSRLYLPKTRENLQKLSTLLRENFSQNLLAQVVAEDVKSKTSPLVCVDGARRPADLEFLKNLPSFYLIQVAADQKVRYERIIKREQNSGESKAELSFEKFCEQEKAEAEGLIDEVAKEAEFVIDNNGTPEELFKQVEKILTKIQSEN